MAIEARKNVRIYNYERHMRSGCALGVFKAFGYATGWLHTGQRLTIVGTIGFSYLGADEV